MSFSAVLIRLAQTDAATVVWLRMGLATVLLGPFAIGELRNSDAARPAKVGGLAGVLLGIHFLTWTASLGLTSIAAAVLLVCLHPLVVIPAAARITGEKVPRTGLAGVALAIAGSVITCGADLGRGAGAVAGDGLAIVAALAMAGYLLTGRVSRARSGVALYATASYAVVTVMGVIAAAATPGLHLPSPRALLACLGLAAICTVGGHTVFTWALRHVRAGTVSTAYLGEPPITAALAFLILGQVPAVATIAGGVLILSGVGLVLLTEHRAPELEPAG